MSYIFNKTIKCPLALENLFLSFSLKNSAFRVESPFSCRAVSDSWSTCCFLHFRKPIWLTLLRASVECMVISFQGCRSTCFAHSSIQKKKRKTFNWLLKKILSFELELWALKKSNPTSPYLLLYKGSVLGKSGQKSHKKEGMKRGEKQWWSGHGRQEKGRASIRVTIMPCRQCASVCLCLFINVYSACVCLVNCLHVASCHIDQLWSFLNAADSVDFSCDWMKGYDGVHMRLHAHITNGPVQILYHY